MPYILVENFNGGLDRRRKISTAPPGTLWELTNAHITRGGEIEKRKTFAPKYNLPAGTLGLTSLSGNLYVFGSGAEPAGMPVGITYQRLQHPSSDPTSSDMTEIVDVEVFDGSLYVIAKFADSSTYHYYDGERITYWDVGTVQGGATSTADIAQDLASLIDADSSYEASVSSSVVTVTTTSPGTGFTISGTTSEGSTGLINWNTTTPNIPAINEVLATGSFDITGGSSNAGTNKVNSVAVNSVTITSAAVDWAVSNEATAAAIAANITAHSSSPNYTATSSGAKVIIKAVANSGTTPNGFAVVCAEAGDVTHSSEVAMAGGVNAVAGVSQVTEFTVTGTWAAGDTYQIILSGTVFGGTTANYTALVLDKKVYITAGSILRFCEINDPTQFDETLESNLGAGFINISNHYSGSDSLTGLGVYNNDLVIFSRNAIQRWSMKSDPESNTKQQTINSTGTRSHKAILAYSDSDLLYISSSGIRTLKARDSSNNARSNDIGRAIDKLVLEQLKTLTTTEIEAVPAVAEGEDGRAWFALKDKIYVLSSFPASGSGNISAWSIYKPGFNVTEMISVDDRVYVRDDNNMIYLYGDDDNETYDDSIVTIQLPFLDAKKPANFKELLGINADCEGVWDIEILVDPRDLNQIVHMGQVDGFTYLDENIDAIGDTTHFAPRFVSSADGYVSLSNVAVHYMAEDERQ